MNTSIQHPEPNGIVQPLGNSSRREAALSAWRSPSAPFVSVALFAGLLFLLLSAPAARADRNPPGCLGSGLGISLFTSLPDVHIGDTIYYSVNVFNAPFPACNAGETNAATAGAIYAFIVTPDGVTNNITLRRTFLAPGDSDVYRGSHNSCESPICAASREVWPRSKRLNSAKSGKNACYDVPRSSFLAGSTLGGGWLCFHPNQV